MIEAIENAFRKRLWEGLPGVPIAWPNVNFNQPPPYVEAVFFWNDPQRLGIGPAVRFLGIFQATVIVPEGQGTGNALDRASAIADLFPMDLRIPVDVGHVRVTAPPTISGGFTDAGTWRLPVSINHETLTQGA